MDEILARSRRDQRLSKISTLCYIPDLELKSVPDRNRAIGILFCGKGLYTL